jgi:prepilin-type processing-associated H-X9-DG protein
VIELAVVMVIVATATLLLLRVASRLKDKSEAVTCQSNMHQILTALTTYTLDNGGYFPYGYYWQRSDPVTWRSLGQGPQDVNNELISWPEVINQYLTGSATADLSQAFTCAEALADRPGHKLSYVMNMIVAVAPMDELTIGSFAPQTKPAKVDLMLKGGSALLWDTPIQANFDYEDWYSYFVGVDVDGQRFWLGAEIPQYRYFLAHDPFAPFSGGIYGNNRPVRMQVGATVYRNIDPPVDEVAGFPFQGNLRFRHNAGTVCNAAFSDGSVRQFTATIGPNKTVTAHDALRRYFMIDWPPGVTPDPAYPF